MRPGAEASADRTDNGQRVTALAGARPLLLQASERQRPFYSAAVAARDHVLPELGEAVGEAHSAPALRAQQRHHGLVETPFGDGVDATARRRRSDRRPNADERQVDSCPPVVDNGRRTPAARIAEFNPQHPTRTVNGRSRAVPSTSNVRTSMPAAFGRTVARPAGGSTTVPPGTAASPATASH